MFATDSQWVVLRPGKETPREEHQADADLGTLHMADFLEAVRTRRQPLCPIEDAFRSTATVQLAMIAYETNSVVRWDAEAEQILANPAAQKLLKREYRAPWTHPHSG